MTLKLSSQELIMEKKYPETFFHDGSGIFENTIHLPDIAGNGFYKEIWFENVHIGYGNASLSNSILIDFESDFETIEMHFSLKGRSYTTPENFEKSYTFESHQHNIVYANSMSGKMLWDSKDFQIFEINLNPAFFKKFLPENQTISDRFRSAIEKKSSSFLSQNHHLISHKMHQIVYEIMNCKRTGLFKRMFLEAKVTELLLLQMEQIMEKPISNQAALKKSEIDKIYAVKEFLNNNLDATTTLTDLAHFVGTNEFTLKKGFKELFGNTVFGFWNDLKMEQAHQLLLDKKYTVGEVSGLIGYKNQRHFATAFKRKFGLSPSYLQQ